MSDTIHILTRTSRRPVLFARLRETVKALTWPGPIVHIVHSDDPRDTYVSGDIIIRGESLDDIRVKRRRASYNLYNNRLLDAIPGDGWVHFIDDDDEYPAPDVFERALAAADPEKVNVCRVHRGDGVIFPAHWGNQSSFQTEIPIMRVGIARDSRWPAGKGGDHTYNRPLAKKYGVHWIDDVLIATTHCGKGNGLRADVAPVDDGALPDDMIVHVKPRIRGAWLAEDVALKKATEMERELGAIVTFRGVGIEYRTVEAPSDPVEFDRDLPEIPGCRRSMAELVEDAVRLGVGSREQVKKHSRTWLARAIRRSARDGYQQYQRVGIVEMRPYIEGEDLSQVRTGGREGRKGDMIERRRDRTGEIRLIPHDEFTQFYRPVEDI